MEPFSAAFLSSLSGKLSANVANSLTGALKRQIAGTPAQQALERLPARRSGRPYRPEHGR